MVNRIFLHEAGGENRPRILAPEDVFPAARRLEESYPVLRAEIETLMERRTIPTYDHFDPVRAAQVSEKWRLYYAYMFGRSNEVARIDLPCLLAFAESTPNVVNAFVSILDAGVTLPAHKDPYAGVLRYHLGIRVPVDNSPRIRLDQEYYTWKDGEGAVLDVNFEHEVYNECDEARIIVIIDFRRPMSLYATWINRYCLWLKRRWAPQFVDASKYDVMHA